MDREHVPHDFERDLAEFLLRQSPNRKTKCDGHGSDLRPFRPADEREWQKNGEQKDTNMNILGFIFLPSIFLPFRSAPFQRSNPNLLHVDVHPRNRSMALPDG